MLALELSALYFKASQFQDTFLVAHFEEPERFKPGEYTSDLLGYFGFGMGSYRMPEGSPPLWAKGKEFFQFPDVQTALKEVSDVNNPKLHVFTEMVADMMRLIVWYAQRDIFLNRYDVRVFINLLATYLNIPLSADRLWSLSEVIDNPSKPVSEGISFFEIDSDGKVSFGFGGPEVEGVPPNMEPFLLAGSDARFDWHHSSQLGTPTNAIRILDSMKGHRYSTKTEEERHAEIAELRDNLIKIKDAI